MRSVAVYGDVSPNVIDGSSIWLASISRVLSEVFDQVHVLLKMRPQTNVLTSQFDEIPNVTVHSPHIKVDSVLSNDEVVAEMETLVRWTGSNAVIARGMDVCNSLVKSSVIGPILWAYVTDLPFPPAKISANNKDRLGQIAHGSHRLFAQTEAARSYLESLAPEAASKTLLMPPMIPDEAFNYSVQDRSSSSELISLVYSGKLAREWKTLEMLDIPAELRKLGINAELTVVGSKFNKSSESPNWVSRMRQTLTDLSSDKESGVVWLGALKRAESLDVIANSDLGIGWRTSKLDSSLEISTKALEYSAVGIPSLINRNVDNVEMFGSDYPLFVDGNATAADAAQQIAKSLRGRNSNELRDLRRDLKSAASEFSMSKAVDRIQRYVTRSGINNPDRTADLTKVLIVSHDFKFLGELIDSLKQDPRFELELDQWSTLHNHDEERSTKFADWADVVLCEWAGPSLVWYSNHLAPNKVLISRLHGFELRTGGWLHEVDFSNVDAMVFVSEHYRARFIAQFHDVNVKSVVVPNAIDCLDLFRPKTPSARFHIGMIGIVPFLKRPDRAVDLLELLTEEDNRYILHFRGRAPWEYGYEWRKPLQKQAYLEFYHSISERNLENNVVFSAFGPDMASWLRRIGFVLSPSVEESFHLAPAEGMASGSIPIVWNREGASDIFGSENVYESTEDMANAILSLQNQEEFCRASSKARDVANSKWDTMAIDGIWKDLFRSLGRGSNRAGANH